MGMADRFRQKAEQLQHEAGKRMGGKKGRGDEADRRSGEAEQATGKGRSQRGDEQRRGGAGEMGDRPGDEPKDRFEH